MKPEPIKRLPCVEELQLGESLRVVQHLEECRDCAALLVERGQFQRAVRLAVRRDAAPAHLARRISRMIRADIPPAKGTYSC